MVFTVDWMQAFGMTETANETRSPIIASWVLLVGTCLLALVPFVGFLAWIIGGVTILIAVVLGIVVISKGGTWSGITILIASLVVVPLFIAFAPIVTSIIAGVAIEEKAPGTFTTPIESPTEAIEGVEDAGDEAADSESEEAGEGGGGAGTGATAESSAASATLEAPANE